MKEEVRAYLDRRAEWVQVVEEIQLVGNLYAQQLGTERERRVAMIIAEGDMLIALLSES